MCLSLCPNKPACEWQLMLLGKFSQFDDFILVLLRDQHFCRLLNLGRVEKSEVCIWAMRKLKEVIMTLDIIIPLLSSETSAWPPGVQDRILVMQRLVMRYSSQSSINPELCSNSKDYLPYPCPFSYPFFSFFFFFFFNDLKITSDDQYNYSKYFQWNSSSLTITFIMTFLAIQQFYVRHTKMRRLKSV